MYKKMSEAKLYKLVDGDKSLEWNRNLKPRENSGIRGHIDIPLHFTVSEIIAIRQKIQSTATDRHALESDVLKYCGVTRETVKADNTKVDMATVIKSFKEKLSEANEQREKPLTAEQIKQVVENAIGLSDENKAELLKAITPEQKPEPEPEQKPEVVFNF